ncbi:MAG: hypothetical protein NVS3B26_19060 [Mycobacteriales bacterium]
MHAVIIGVDPHKRNNTVLVLDASENAWRRSGSQTTATVLNVPAKLSACVRALGGGSGRKTDDTDAFAVAVAGLRDRGLELVSADRGLAGDVEPPPGSEGRGHTTVAQGCMFREITSILV